MLKRPTAAAYSGWAWWRCPNTLAPSHIEFGQSVSRAVNLRRILRVAAGNALEMYDFQIFGFYAPAIARAFFPSGSEYTSLILTLTTFGAGFLMRPLGAIVLGAYLDYHGRRAGLLLTLTLMGFSTLL